MYSYKNDKKKKKFVLTSTRTRENFVLNSGKTWFIILFLLIIFLAFGVFLYFKREKSKGFGLEQTIDRLGGIKLPSVLKKYGFGFGAGV